MPSPLRSVNVVPIEGEGEGDARSATRTFISKAFLPTPFPFANPITLILSAKWGDKISGTEISSRHRIVSRRETNATLVIQGHMGNQTQRCVSRV